VTTVVHPWPPVLRWERRRLVAALIVGLILALGPVWGLLYTLWYVLVATVEAGRDLSLQEVRQVTLSIKPTLAGLAVAPIGIAICAWCVVRLAALRRKALEIENRGS